jgi:hypothetical protein
MVCEDTETYKGFKITGTAELWMDRWHSMVLLEKEAYASEGIPICPVCDSAQQAIVQALCAGRAMIDSPGFCLSADPDCQRKGAASIKGKRH